MGAQGVTWLGQSFFIDTPDVFQNLGDGTYFHSGILAIRQTVAAGVNITYKILYNDAVAMTGGQKLDGELSVPQLIYQLVGEGVKRIAVVSDYPKTLRKDLPHIEGLTLDHRRKLDTIQKNLREFHGTSVIVYVQTCAAEKRRRRKHGVLEDPRRRVFINPDVCEGCGDCSRTSNCLSVLPLETELGRKRRIDQDACNKDFSCLEGFCPSFVTVEGGELRKPKPITQAIALHSLPEPKLPTLERPWNIVVAGVGGTGVLTVSALIAMAAHIEGKGCATMNQTGLAQKFGAVVSHVRIARQQSDIIAVRIAAGDADLLLGCDLAVGASNDALVRANVERTAAVINQAEVPTSDFVFDRDAVFPAIALRASIAAEVGGHKVQFVDATALAHGLVGDNIGANLLLLGYAWQQGLVPVSIEALHRAIELNGTAVDFNKCALDWGRRAAVDLAGVMKLAGIPQKPWRPLQSLEDIVADRKRRLVDYQNARYAQHYHDWIKHIHSAERELRADSAEPLLSKAVARSLYKLMAYKDEYEVARLYSDGTFLKQVDEAIEGNYQLQFHLAPPLFSRADPQTGRPRKFAMPGWLIKTSFALLAKAKVLRGTYFDPFAHTADRKLEYSLIAAYESTLDRLLLGLAPHNYAIAVQIAELPMQIRGFGPVKAAAVELVRQRERELFVDFERGPDLQIVKFVTRAA